MPEPIEEFFVSVGSDISKLLNDTKKGTKEAEKELDSFSKKGQQSLVSLEARLKDMGITWDKNVQRFRKNGRFINTRQFDELKKKFPELESVGKKSFANIGNAIKKATGLITAMVAAVVGVIAAMKKATDAAVENERAFANLAGSAAAANREFGRGVGSAKSWEQSVKDVSKEMRVFSERSVANATTRLIDMTKRLGFTEDQMITLLKRTGDLSAGKVDLEGGIERVSAAMRGEAESAEFLGLSLNENSVKAYAEAQGLVWKQLSDTEKAQQRYNLFLQQTNELQGRAAKFAESLAGQEAALNAQLENQAALLGEQLIPLRQGYAQALGLLASESGESGSIVTNALAGVAAAAGTVVIAIRAMVENSLAAFKVLSAGTIALLNFEDPIAATKAAVIDYTETIANNANILGNLPDIARQAFDDIRAGWEEQRDLAKQAAQETGTAGGGSPLLGPLIDGAEDGAEELNEILKDVGRDLLDLQAEINADMEENAREHTDTLAEIEKEGAQERLEINQKFDEELADSRADIFEQAKEDLERLQQETDRDIAKRRNDANREEMRETEDHLTDMRRLRLSFLDNLEDAVKSRDAGRVRDLQRQFQRESQERQQDFEKGQSRERSDAQAEIAETVANEQRRAQEIIKQRTEALAEVERRVQENRDKELMALDEKLAMERERENARFAERQQELDTAADERLKRLAIELADTEDLQEKSAQRILEILNETFGADGSIEELMRDFANRRRQTLTLEIGFEQKVKAGNKAIQSGGASAGFGGNPGSIASFQHGGTLLATKPTLAMFGEAGPELAQFTPISKMGSMGGGGKMEIDLKLSGSAPPGIRSADRDAIAGVLVNALAEAGVRVKSKGR